MSRSRKTLRTIVTGDFMENLSFVAQIINLLLQIDSLVYSDRKITSCATQQLSKNVSNLIDKFLIFKIAGFYLRQLLKQLPLLARQTCRRNDGNRNEEIA